MNIINQHNKNIPIPVPELHYWSFLGNADDVVGGNNGITSGASLTTDKDNNADSAYLFNGTSDYIGLTSLSNIGTVHSITLRINLSKWVAMAPRSTSGNYLYFITDSQVQYYTGNLISFNVPEMQLSQYYDFALVRDGLSVKLYIDGVQQGGEQTLSSDDDFTLDLITANTTWWFGGVMDNMRIYDRALSWGEVTKIHNE